MSSAADDVARALARFLETCANAMDGRGASDWIDQHDSQMGPRLHIRAVRRRLAEGAPGAKELPGRRFVLTPEAYKEEMRRSIKPGLRKTRGHGGPDGAIQHSAPSPSPQEKAKAAMKRLRLLRSKGP